LKRFFIILLIAAVFFIAGVLVGRFVMPRKVEITVIDVNDLVEIIERYNEAKWEIEKMKEWNKDVVVEPELEEEKK